MTDEALFQAVYEYVGHKLGKTLHAVPVQKVIDRLHLPFENNEGFRNRLIALGFGVQKFAHLLPDGTFESMATSEHYCIFLT